MALAAIAVTLLLSCVAVPSQALSSSILDILAPYPNLSVLSQWLNITGVANEIDSRTGITIFAPPNGALSGYVGGMQQNTKTIADTLRYNVLLTYYGMPELQKIEANNYTSVATLLQATGRSNQSQGFVTIYNTGTQLLVGHFTPDSFGNATIFNNVTFVPYEYSILEISSVLVPITPNALAPSPAPSPETALVPAPVPAPVSPPPAIPLAAPPVLPAETLNQASPLKSISASLSLLAMLFAYGVAALL